MTLVSGYYWVGSKRLATKGKATIWEHDAINDRWYEFGSEIHWSTKEIRDKYVIIQRVARPKAWKVNLKEMA